jgi:hypothetical protein
VTRSSIRAQAYRTCWTAAPSKKRSVGDEVLSWCRGTRVTPKLATSCLAGIRGSFVSIRRVVEVCLDRGFGAAQPTCDLGDRKALLVAVVPSERAGAPAFLHAVSRLCDFGRHSSRR